LEERTRLKTGDRISYHGAFSSRISGEGVILAIKEFSDMAVIRWETPEIREYLLSYDGRYNPDGYLCRMDFLKKVDSIKPYSPDQNGNTDDDI